MTTPKPRTTSNSATEKPNAAHQEPGAALPPDLMPLKAATELAQCHIATLHRWIQDGQLAAWKRRGRSFVSRAAVLALFERQPTSEEVLSELAMIRAGRKRERQAAAATLPKKAQS